MGVVYLWWGWCYLSECPKGAVDPQRVGRDAGDPAIRMVPAQLTQRGGATGSAARCPAPCYAMGAGGARAAAARVVGCSLRLRTLTDYARACWRPARRATTAHLQEWFHSCTTLHPPMLTPRLPLGVIFPTLFFFFHSYLIK